MRKSSSQTAHTTPFFPGLDTDVCNDTLVERSILIDDSYDDQTEILTIIRDRVARDGVL
ncbi:hypothetical protein [Hyphomicrobium sp.]|jgi:hypothetical protein|uniref:hypothetical protein n=1 Tax=Hyphomicrobium sp. TaxID=82 RepID=UPI003569E32E